MLFTLLQQASPGSRGFNVTGLVIVAVVFAVVYPLQKRLRAKVSERRLERWRRADPGIPDTTANPNRTEQAEPHPLSGPEGRQPTRPEPPDNGA